MPLESDFPLIFKGTLCGIYGMRGQFLCGGSTFDDSHRTVSAAGYSQGVQEYLANYRLTKLDTEFVVSTPIECVLRVDLARRGGVPPSHPEVALVGNRRPCVTQDSLYGLMNGVGLGGIMLTSGHEWVILVNLLTCLPPSGYLARHFRILFHRGGVIANPRVISARPLGGSSIRHGLPRVAPGSHLPGSTRRAQMSRRDPARPTPSGLSKLIEALLDRNAPRLGRDSIRYDSDSARTSFGVRGTSNMVDTMASPVAMAIVL